MNVDVLLVGAGPASSAAAVALAPHCKVALLEKRPHDTPDRIGESLASAAQHVLSDLGVLESFLSEGHPRWYRSVSVWGSEEPTQIDFLHDPNGPGWHVDRSRFDPWLRNLAVERGALLLRPAALLDVRRQEGWRVQARTPWGNIELSAKLVVDGTGRRRALSRLLRAKWKVSDRLLAQFVHGTDSTGHARGLTFVEAVADGWWYTAPERRNERVLVFHSDTDLSRGRARCTSSLMSQAFNTLCLRRLLQDAGFHPRGEAQVAAAHAATYPTPYGDDWLAVGDAALTCDPISSQGLFNALFTGMAAAESIREYLAGGRTALQQYRAVVDGIANAYLVNHSVVYAAEGRWPQRQFWQRRWAQGSLVRSP